MTVNSSVLVKFGDGSDGTSVDAHLSVEIDDRTNGLNGGKTSFSAGDSVGLLFYRSSNVVIVSATPSAGFIAAQGQVTFEKTEDLIFPGDDTATLGAPCSAANITSAVWMGNNGGAITLGADKMTVTIAQPIVGVCRVTYQVTPDAYRLASPASINGAVDYSIALVVEGGLQ